MIERSIKVHSDDNDGEFRLENHGVFCFLSCEDAEYLLSILPALLPKMKAKRVEYLERELDNVMTSLKEARKAL